MIPALTSLSIVALLPFMLSIETKFIGELLSSGPFKGYSADAARLILSSISTAVMTVIGTLFSITIVVVQQASAQFSPRIVEIFIKARNSQFVLGLYVGTFVYAILLLRQIPATDPEGDLRIPQAAISLAIVLALLCIAFLVQYVHFITHSIKSTKIIQSIISDAEDFLSDFEGFKRKHAAFTESGVQRPNEYTLFAEKNGYFQSFFPDKIDTLLGSAGTSLSFEVFVGDYVRKSDPLVKLQTKTPLSSTHLEKLHRYLNLGAERTHVQDVRYSIRQLVDMALRALSPSVNDPSTAIEVLNGIWVVMSRWMKVPELPETLRFEHGLEIKFDEYNFSQMLELSFSQIIVASEGHYVVIRRIEEILKSLMDSTEDRKKTISRYLRYVENLSSSEKPKFIGLSENENRIH